MPEASSVDERGRGGTLLRKRAHRGSIIEVVVLLGVLSSGPMLFGTLYASPGIAMNYPQLVVLACVMTVGFLWSVGFVFLYLPLKRRLDDVAWRRSDRALVREIRRHNEELKRRNSG